MYNSPTAGTEHVHLCSQVGRQTSLSNWHLMLVMCERKGGVICGLLSWSLAHVYVWKNQKGVLM